MAKVGKTINNVIRGDSRQINLTFLQSDGVTPIDLTGGTVYFTVQSVDNPPDDVTDLDIQKIATDATPFTSPTTGQHTFTLTHDDTNIDPNTYWYDASLKDSVGNYLSSYRGKFILQSDITRT